MIRGEVLDPLCCSGLLQDIAISEHTHFEDRRYMTTLLCSKAIEYRPSVQVLCGSLYKFLQNRILDTNLT